MKRFKFIGLALVGALTLFFQSCEQSMDDLANNPNTPTEVSSEWMLTAAQKNMMDNLWDEWINGRQGLMYSQYWSATSYTEESRYQIRESVNRTFWRAFYTSLADLENGKGIAEDEAGTANKQAILDIMQCWGYLMLTDMYGDVPYSEALNPETLSPKYDAQVDIYMDIATRLQASVNTLGAGGVSFGSGDIMFSGDTGKWQRFANSLLLRMAMRMTDVDAATAQSWAAAATAGAGVMTSNADNALFYYQTSAPNNNPLNENAKTRADFACSDVLVSYMDSLSDPRLGMYADPAVNTGTYEGMPYGMSNANATAIPNEDVSMPGALVLAATAPGVFMDYAEVCFNLAEAASYGWVSGDAATHYEDGIMASMDYWGVDATDASDYIAANPYTSGDPIDVIGTQKWLAMYPNGTAAWYEITRMDFDQPNGERLFVDPVDGSLDPDITPGNLPVRMTYVDEEASLNLTNLTSAVSGLNNGDSKSSMIWWNIK